MPESLRPVPEWFTREMRAIDPTLVVRWHEREQRWVIMRPRSPGEPPSALTQRDITERPWWKYVTVFRVENEDGSYRDLDMRIIHAMRKADGYRRDWREMLAEIEKSEQDHEKDRFRDLDARRVEIAKDLKAALTNRYLAGYGGTVAQYARSLKREA